MKNYIVDTTLRDGEQAPGVIMNSYQKMEIARLLDDLGVDEVEVGTPAMGDFEQKIIKQIATAGFSFKTISWCRAIKKDIKKAALCKTDAVSISFPVSDIQLKAINKDRIWVAKEMPKLVEYAREYFDRVYVGLQDASRCEMPVLKGFVELARLSKADRIRIADTVGLYSPVEVSNVFANLSKSFPDVDFELHAHNDLGMASANAFMALQYGATGISATVNGLGERAGNAALEEVIMAMSLKNNAGNYNTKVINTLCNCVADASGRALHQSKPISGSGVFTHETGVHVRSLMSDKRSYQAFDEAMVGVEANNIVIGKHSGKAALTHFFNKHGVAPTVNQLKEIHNNIVESISLRGKVPNERFIMSLYDNLQFSTSY